MFKKAGPYSRLVDIPKQTSKSVTIKAFAANYHFRIALRNALSITDVWIDVILYSVPSSKI